MTRMICPETSKECDFNCDGRCYLKDAAGFIANQTNNLLGSFSDGKSFSAQQLTERQRLKFKIALKKSVIKRLDPPSGTVLPPNNF